MVYDLQMVHNLMGFHILQSLKPNSRKRGKLIRDNKFEYLWVEPFSLENLPLDKGCYLRNAHIAELTGLKPETLSEKIPRHVKDIRELGYHKTWCFVDREIYSRLDKQSRD